MVAYYVLASMASVLLLSLVILVQSVSLKKLSTKNENANSLSCSLYKELGDYQELQGTLIAENSRLQFQLSQLKKEHDPLLAAIAEHEKTIETIAFELADQKQENETLKSELDALRYIKQSFEESKSELTRLQGALDERDRLLSNHNAKDLNLKTEPSAKTRVKRAAK